ncbi:hypothetical protein Hypma_005306 [Hypsizygus marmoreus]|uniref:Uncharacterized protein n=1 Tax=Hypsizygus marmoreus TaxID=39966 RepID=A0A369JZT0_HYPMA|nr:hypothetical protein Hypma_005306 [Hypsizygus marmoreus]
MVQLRHVKKPRRTIHEQPQLKDSLRPRLVGKIMGCQMRARDGCHRKTFAPKNQIAHDVRYNMIKNGTVHAFYET